MVYSRIRDPHDLPLTTQTPIPHQRRRRVAALNNLARMLIPQRKTRSAFHPPRTWLISQKFDHGVVIHGVCLDCDFLSAHCVHACSSRWHRDGISDLFFWELVGLDEVSTPFGD